MGQAMNGAERPRLVQTQCWCPRDLEIAACDNGVILIYSVQFSEQFE
jgi:hypothetical protein